MFYWNSLVFPAAPATPSAPTAIGQFWGGGFFVGTINDGGQHYYLVLAPKASGARSGQGPGGVDATACTSRSNGLFNTDILAANGSPDALWCKSLTIGGFNDWYMPAVEEWDIAYPVVKDAAATSGTFFGCMATNPDAVPPRTFAWSGANDPPMTSVPAFQAGGSEDCGGGAHWSSTVGDAWVFTLVFFPSQGDIYGHWFPQNGGTTRAMRRHAVGT
jgi:hypothetical protein